MTEEREHNNSYQKRNFDVFNFPLAESSFDDIGESGKSFSATTSQSRIIVVSCRLPIHMEKIGGDQYFFSLSSGGFVSGLNAVKDKEVIWVGWPGTDVDPIHQSQIEKEARTHNCYPVFLPPELVRSFYDGFSNSVLWPILHSISPTLEHRVYIPSAQSSRTIEQQWEAYEQANNLFLETILSIYRPDDIIWIHDYHLMLLPKMIRERLNKLDTDSYVRTGDFLRIGWFLHTPFPSHEFFSPMPYCSQLLQGVLSANLVGFHLNEYSHHFIATCTHSLGLSATSGEIEATRIGGVRVSIYSVPMGIDVNSFTQKLFDPGFCHAVLRLRQKFGKRKVILGVDRLDYIKGLPQKLMCYEYLMKKYPSLIEECVFVQLSIPSRTDSNEYRKLKSKIYEEVGRMNGKYGKLGYVPIHYLDQASTFDELVALYRVASVFFISSIRDGFNLTAYEYAVCQQPIDSTECSDVNDLKDDNTPGVLVISEFAGVSSLLGSESALILNPWSIEETSMILWQAIHMSKEERRQRHSNAMETIRNNSSGHWANKFISELQRVTQDNELQQRSKPSFLPLKSFFIEFSNAYYNYFSAQQKLIFNRKEEVAAQIQCGVLAPLYDAGFDATIIGLSQMEKASRLLEYSIMVIFLSACLVFFQEEEMQQERHPIHPLFSPSITPIVNTEDLKNLERFLSSKEYQEALITKESENSTEPSLVIWTTPLLWGNEDCRSIGEEDRTRLENPLQRKKVNGEIISRLHEISIAPGTLLIVLCDETQEEVDKAFGSRLPHASFVAETGCWYKSSNLWNKRKNVMLLEQKMSGIVSTLESTFHTASSWKSNVLHHLSSLQAALEQNRLSKLESRLNKQDNQVDKSDRQSSKPEVASEKSENGKEVYGGGDENMSIMPIILQLQKQLEEEKEEDLIISKTNSDFLMKFYSAFRASLSSNDDAQNAWIPLYECEVNGEEAFCDSLILTNTKWTEAAKVIEPRSPLSWKSTAKDILEFFLERSPGSKIIEYSGSIRLHWQQSFNKYSSILHEHSLGELIDIIYDELATLRAEGYQLDINYTNNYIEITDSNYFLGRFVDMILKLECSREKSIYFDACLTKFSSCKIESQKYGPVVRLFDESSLSKKLSGEQSAERNEDNIQEGGERLETSLFDSGLSSSERNAPGEEISIVDSSVIDTRGLDVSGVEDSMHDSHVIPPFSQRSNDSQRMHGKKSLIDHAKANQQEPMEEGCLSKFFEYSVQLIMLFALINEKKENHIHGLIWLSDLSWMDETAYDISEAFILENLLLQSTTEGSKKHLSTRTRTALTVPVMKDSLTTTESEGTSSLKDISKQEQSGVETQLSPLRRLIDMTLHPETSGLERKKKILNKLQKRILLTKKKQKPRMKTSKIQKRPRCQTEDLRSFESWKFDGRKEKKKSLSHYSRQSSLRDSLKESISLPLHSRVLTRRELNRKKWNQRIKGLQQHAQNIHGKIYINNLHTSLAHHHPSSPLLRLSGESDSLLSTLKKKSVKIYSPLSILNTMKSFFLKHGYNSSQHKMRQHNRHSPLRWKHPVERERAKDYFPSRRKSAFAQREEKPPQHPSPQFSVRTSILKRIRSMFFMNKKASMYKILSKFDYDGGALKKKKNEFYLQLGSIKTLVEKNGSNSAPSIMHSRFFETSSPSVPNKSTDSPEDMSSMLSSAKGTAGGNTPRIAEGFSALSQKNILSELRGMDESSERKEEREGKGEERQEKEEKSEHQLEISQIPFFCSITTKSGSSQAQYCIPYNEKVLIFFLSQIIQSSSFVQSQIECAPLPSPLPIFPLNDSPSFYEHFFPSSMQPQFNRKPTGRSTFVFDALMSMKNKAEMLKEMHHTPTADKQSADTPLSDSDSILLSPPYEEPLSVVDSEAHQTLLDSQNDLLQRDYSLALSVDSSTSSDMLRCGNESFGVTPSRQIRGIKASVVPNSNINCPRKSSPFILLSLYDQPSTSATEEKPRKVDGEGSDVFTKRNSQQKIVFFDAGTAEVDRHSRTYVVPMTASGGGKNAITPNIKERNSFLFPLSPLGGSGREREGMVTPLGAGSKGSHGLDDSIKELREGKRVSSNALEHILSDQIKQHRRHISVSSIYDRDDLDRERTKPESGREKVSHEVSGARRDSWKEKRKDSLDVTLPMTHYRSISTQPVEKELEDSVLRSVNKRHHNDSRQLKKRHTPQRAGSVIKLRDENEESEVEDYKAKPHVEESTEIEAVDLKAEKEKIRSPRSSQRRRRKEEVPLQEIREAPQITPKAESTNPNRYQLVLNSNNEYVLRLIIEDEESDKAQKLELQRLIQQQEEQLALLKTQLQNMEESLH